MLVAIYSVGWKRSVLILEMEIRCGGTTAQGVGQFFQLHNVAMVCVFFSHPSHSRLKRTNDGQALRGVGRPSYLSIEGVEALRKMGTDRAESGRAFTRTTFGISLEAAAKNEAKKKKQNIYAVKTPSPSTLNKYRARTVPKKVAKPNTQNIKREQV